MRARLFALLLLALAACKTDDGGGSTATAARSPASASAMVRLAGSHTVIFRGDVTYGTTKALLELIKANPAVTTVHLTSDGGYVHPALIVANTLQLRGATTFVPSECVSACTLLFLGGETRYLAPGAKLGFHRAWRNLDEPEDRGTQMTNEEIRQRLLERGVSAAFAEQVLATPSTEVWYPTAEEMLEAGVIDGVVSHDQLPPP
ncbi:MAG TPA: hypothetical protein VJL84_04140 [Kiloniellales bacterium]|nr:hypothetical protein [Kiloniellales bacterium]